MSLGPCPRELGKCLGPLQPAELFPPGHRITLLTCHLQDGAFDVTLVLADEAADKALVWALAPSLTLPPGATGSNVALPTSVAARYAL